MDKEKDINFTIYNTNPNNLCDGRVEVTSDLDQDVNYLDFKEKVAVIKNIINKCCEQVILQQTDTLDAEDYIEDEEKHDMVISSLYELAQEMIYLVLNTIYGNIANKYKLKSEILEYAMQVFEKDEEDILPNAHMPKIVLYSQNVMGIDPMKAGFSMCLDVVDAMLEDGNMSKQEIKKFVTGATQNMLKDFMDRIDEF